MRKALRDVSHKLGTQYASALRGNVTVRDVSPIDLPSHGAPGGLVQKPSTSEKLLERIRELLDEPSVA